MVVNVLRLVLGAPLRQPKPPETGVFCGAPGQPSTSHREPFQAPLYDLAEGQVVHLRTTVEQPWVLGPCAPLISRWSYNSVTVGQMASFKYSIF